MVVKIKLLALCVYLILLESCHLYVRAQVDSDSCSGRCGKSMSLPCSCHNTCVVYNNCCEDINLQCPQIMKESRAKFDKNFNNHVECTDNGVFMITGCMRPSDQGQNDTTPRSLDTQSFLVTSEETNVMSKISKFAGKSKSVQALFTMLSSTDESVKSLSETFMSAPVTDASTGLVYKNFTIFSCDATNLSIPHVWKASVSVLLTDELNNLQELSNVSDAADVVYTPPDQMSSVSYCRPDCIHHCEQEVDDDTADLRDKCELGGSTYVTVFSNSQASCYKNMYCEKCNLNGSFIPRYLKIPYSGKTTERQLSVVMSLSDNKLKLSPGNERSKLDIPWEEKTCLLENLSADLDDDVMECHVKSCQAGFVKRPDDVCRLPVIDRFAVADDDFPLTAEDIRILPKFVQCLIKEAVNDEIVLVRPDVNTVHDTRLNTTIHITYIETFAKRIGVLLDTDLNSRKTFTKLSAIAKSFQRYRQNKRMSTNCRDSEDSTSLDSTRHFSLSSDTANPKMSSLKTSELYHVRFENWDRGAAVDNVTKTTTCFCRNPGTSDCVVACSQDLWYVEEDNIIAEFLDLPCLADVETATSETNNQASSGQKVTVWVLVFMIYILVMIG